MTMLFWLIFFLPWVSFAGKQSLELRLLEANYEVIVGTYNALEDCVSDCVEGYDTDTTVALPFDLDIGLRPTPSKYLPSPLGKPTNEEVDAVK